MKEPPLLTPMGEIEVFFDGISAYDYDNSFCENGVQYNLLPFTKTSDYVFFLAWMEEHDPENEAQTWFGADPTML